MQNKPNFQKSQMNVSIFSQMDYENLSDWTLGENKPNQSQSLVKDLNALVNARMFISKTVKILVHVSGHYYNLSKKILISQGSERLSVRLGQSWELTLRTCSG